MMDILKGIGVDWRERRLVMNLYLQQRAVVKVMQEFTEENEIVRGDAGLLLVSIAVQSIC